MISFRKLAHGSGLRFLSFAAAAGVAFVIMPFVIHSIGDRDYGIWTLVAGYVGYYGLLDFGLSTAVTRHMATALVSKDKEQTNRIFWTSFSLYAFLGLAVLVLTVVLTANLSLVISNHDTVVLARKLLLVLGASFALSFPLRVFVGALNADLRFDITAGLEIVTLAIRTTLIVAFLRMSMGVLGLAWATIITSIIVFGLHALATKKQIPALEWRREHVHRMAAKELFSYATPSFLISVADLLRFQLDGIIIAAYLGAAVVTHFNIGSTLVQYFITLMMALFGVLAPVFSRQSDTNESRALRQTYFFSTRLSIIVSSFIAFGLIVWGRPFISVWMGNKYADAYPVLVYLTLGCTFALWQNPSVQLLYGVSKHGIYAIFNLIEGIANLLLSLFLVHKFGMVGVALGTAIPMAVMKLFVQPVYVAKVTGIDLGGYIRNALGTLLSVSIALIPGLLFTLKFSGESLRTLFVVGLSSLAAYLVIIWLLEFRSMILNGAFSVPASTKQ